MSQEDTAYFANRAAQEWQMVERSTDTNAQSAHRRLAKMYAERADQPAPLIQINRA